MDKIHRVQAGFYYTNNNDVVRCEFCDVELGHWKGDDQVKDHRRWIPSYGFIKGMFVGNIPIGSTDQPNASPQQRAPSYDVCGLTWSCDLIRGQYAISILDCIYSLLYCVFYNPGTNFKFSFTATNPRILNKLYENTTPLCGTAPCLLRSP